MNSVSMLPPIKKKTSPPPLDKESDDTTDVEQGKSQDEKRNVFKFNRYVILGFIFAIVASGLIGFLITYIVMKTNPETVNVDLTPIPFKLSRKYYMQDYNYPKIDKNDYTNWRVAKLKWINTNLKSIFKFDYWSDKIKFARCTDGMAGVRTVPILWSTNSWNDAAKNRLRHFLKRYDYKANGTLFGKPGHLANSFGYQLEINDNSNEQINKFVSTIDEMTKITDYTGMEKTELSKQCPIAKQQMKSYIDRWVSLQNEYNAYLDFRYIRAVPSIIIQKKFDLHNFPEVKIYVVFGKVINFKTHNHHYVGVRPNGDLFTEQGDCSELRSLMQWNKIIPQIERFASLLHTEFVRVDIFPTSTTQFYVNEVEFVSGGAFPLTVIETLTKKKKEMDNSQNQDNYFLQNDDDTDFLCDIQEYETLPIDL